MAVDVGEAVGAAGVGEGEPFVVDPQLMQDRGLDVVDVNRVFGAVKAKFIGLANRLPHTHTTASHPHRERLRVMVATELSSQRTARFHHRRTSQTRRPRQPACLATCRVALSL